MIYSHQPPKQFNDAHWRRINMRKVAHLIGAEMIHNLYGRHWPQINSVRFSNTMTTYKDGVVESYAPLEEWSYLQRWVSEKFINLDPIIIREIEEILNPTYALTNELSEHIDKTDLSSISNAKLATLLIDIMDIPLGEIYKLNVVQIEYGLNFALDIILQEYEPDASERNRLLAKLISPTELTIAQQEEVAFGEITTVAHELGEKPLSNPHIKSLLQKHVDDFAGKHCAYGELPPTLKAYENKLQASLASTVNPVTLSAAQTEVDTLHLKSQELLTLLDDKRLTVLCNLMTRIGVFRDKNKARLGDTVLRRLKLLDEVSRRCNVDRKDLDLYLMTELTTLLDCDKKPSSSELDKRRQGVTFIRQEYASTKVLDYANVTTAIDSNSLKGICASPGIVRGTVKIIMSHEDIDKMNEGDIMVAIGTDFDLIEIMHRAAGIITEEGGLLSHASVVSRELKKPCLIGVNRATTRLKDGVHITLNATEGTIIFND